MKYINEFHQLNCAPDVLEIVNPMGKKPAKEITESMAVMRAIKRRIFVMRKRYGKIGLLDLCAGNALTSVLAVHLFPDVYAIAIDKRERQRKWERADRFEYDFYDIYEPMPSRGIPYIICSVHCCGNLAKRVIEIYQADPLAQHLVMMPCCNGTVPNNNATKSRGKILSKYELWVDYLAGLCDGFYYADDDCISPKNMIIVASKTT